MSYRILLVGSGGREHALAWKIASSALCERLIVAPGNPGIEALGHGSGTAAGKLVCTPVSADAIDGLLALAVSEKIDVVVCGPESPLVAGLGDAFAARGIRFFGPTRAAAEIEGSKAFAKRMMSAARVPTADFGSFDSVAAADAFMDRQSGPVVVKADGLCAGKGVVVTSTHDEAKAAVRQMLGDRVFGAAGARVVIEERLFGREVSMMGLVDGRRFVLLASAEDHKQVFDQDRGPNTGGMGAYSPSPLVDDAIAARIAEGIFAPAVRAMADGDRPVKGLLYGGLMLTAERGPMVIEWNCRFGDPETQAVLVRMEDDLVPWLLATSEGELPGRTPRWKPGVSVCVVLAAEGYPATVRTGDVIEGLASDGQIADSKSRDAGVLIFHAATRRKEDRFITAGGRVLGVTAVGCDLDDARARVYAAIATIRWPGMHFRKDIGLRGRA